MDIMPSLHFTGLVLAVGTFLIIGLFHPIVIKVEYYFGTRLWWVFLVAGIGFIAAAMLVAMSWCRPCWAWWVPRACGASARFWSSASVSRRDGFR